MIKSALSALWSAAKSPRGQAVLTLGVTWVVDRLSKGSPKAQKVIALTAREVGRLEALAGKTDTQVDDMVVTIVGDGVASVATKRLIAETVKLLRDNPAETSTILVNALPLKAPPE